MIQKTSENKKLVIILILNVSYTNNYKKGWHFVSSTKKGTESVDSKVLKTKNGRPMLSSKCAVCGNKI